MYNCTYKCTCGRYGTDLMPRLLKMNPRACMAMVWCWERDWSLRILIRELMAMEG
jgi:hypothetical protein